jgi:hypothetical protein
MFRKASINLDLIVFLLCKFVWIRKGPQAAGARESCSISRELPNQKAIFLWTLHDPKFYHRDNY